MATVRWIPIKLLDPNPNQPRTMIDPAEIVRLAASLKTHGQKVPLLVTPRGNRRFLIVAGERRFRAAQTAGITKLKCIVETMTDNQVQEIALIDNIQRSDLHPIEECRAFQALVAIVGSTMTLCSRIGKSAAYVQSRLSLTKINPALDCDQRLRALGVGQLKHIATLPYNLQSSALSYIFKGGLNSDQAKRYCRKIRDRCDSPFALISPVVPPFAQQKVVRLDRWSTEGGELLRTLVTMSSYFETAVVARAAITAGEMQSLCSTILKERSFKCQ